MQVIRDNLWTLYLRDATSHYKLTEPNEKCVKLANARWMCKMRYQQLRDEKAKRKIIVIDKAPDTVNEQRDHVKMCMATTMSGKRCNFRAVCGNFCRKHKVSTQDLGHKADISDMLSRLDGIKIN